jgi:carbonic anhydrase
MASIRYKNQMAPMPELSIENLLPQERSYFSYDGSLTTPPLYESVSWIVFKQPITVTEEQIAKFRQLYYDVKEQVAEGEEPQPVTENFRPTQPLWDRQISFLAN